MPLRWCAALSGHDQWY